MRTRTSLAFRFGIGTGISTREILPGEVICHAWLAISESEYHENNTYGTEVGWYGGLPKTVSSLHMVAPGHMTLQIRIYDLAGDAGIVRWLCLCVE